MINIPTLLELYNGVLADLETEYTITFPVFGKLFLKALAAVQAGKLKLYYLAIGKIQKNIFVDTADPESLGGTLERFGRVKIGRDPFPASQGKYIVTVTGMFGGIIPAQTTFKSDDSSISPGKLFILDNAYTLTATSDTITLRALEAGVGSKLAVGNTLTATAPIINVDGAGTVASELVAPIEAETIEDYRRVTMESYRLEPQGGATADFRLWGKDAEGVKQIYPYAASARTSELNVFVEAVLADSTDGMGTPTTTILNDVAACIETDPDTGQGRRPMGVWAVNTLPVTIDKVAVTIVGLTGLTTEQEDLIFSALTDEIATIRPFIGGADVLADKKDNLGINNITSTVLNAIPNAVFTTATMTIQVGAGSPVSAISKTFTNGEIPFLISVDYV